jgi:hypothetical protein
MKVQLRILMHYENRLEGSDKSLHRLDILKMIKNYQRDKLLTRIMILA